MRLLAAMLVLAMVTVTACGDDDDSGANGGANGKSSKEHVSMLLAFLPDMISVPYLMAKEKGYMEQCGFDFEPKSAADVENPTQLLLKGQVDYAILDPFTYLSALDKGLPVTSIAEDSVHTGVAYASLAKTGINGAEDLPGHTVGIQPGLDSKIFFDYIVENEVPQEQQDEVKTVPVGFDIRPLMTNSVDVINLFPTNTNINELEEKGEKFNLIRASDYGIDLQAGLIVTTKDRVEDNPDEVKRFLTAISLGQQAALDPANADEAVDLVFDALPDIDVSRDVERKIYPEVMKLRQGGLWDEKGPGFHNPEAFAQAQELLQGADLLDEPLPEDELYTDQFLEEIFSDGPELDPAKACG
jgi:NitT/TauT family transport system substrate-binding protein